MPGIRLNDTERRLLNWWQKSPTFPYPMLRRLSIRGE
ncbi:MAG: hypothetical protein AVDCRST_MAG93-6134, partial [uncultured Chloroflexia bacterium]